MGEPSSPASSWSRFFVLSSIAIGLALVNLYLWFVFGGRSAPGVQDLEAPAELTFDGTSTGLGRSTVLATLKRPIPEGRSAVWCCTMAMAWKETESVLKSPIEVQGAETASRELTNGPIPELDPSHFLAMGGKIEDGIYDRIYASMAQRFPNTPLFVKPESLPSHRAVGFAHLEVSVLYDFLFKHDDRPMTFRDNKGTETKVHAFGLPEKAKGEDGGIREQVLVLFRDKDEFAVDLSHNTKPYQIILARLNRKDTLEQTLNHLKKKTASVEPKHLSHNSVLLVPSMNWRIVHNFEDLLGPISNIPDWYIAFVLQSIQFKMDRKGAYVLSSAIVGTDNGHPTDTNPDYFQFDRPFLIVLKKRGTQHPFFVMWVDNSELLQPH